MWENIIANIKKTSFSHTFINGKPADQQEVIQRIKILWQYYGEKYTFEDEYFTPIEDLLRQMSVTNHDTVLGTYYLFHITNAIKQIENIDGADRLLFQLGTHKNYIDQLLITYLFNHFGIVQNVEDKIKKWDSDINLSIENIVLFTQVKVVNQEYKFIELGKSINIINNVLENSKSEYYLNNIRGVVPKKLTKNDWYKKISKLSVNSNQKYNIKFENIDTKKIDEVTLEFGKKNEGSSFEGSLINLPLFRLPQILTDIKKRADTLDNRSYPMLICIVPYDVENKVEINEKTLKLYSLSAILFFSYHTDSKGNLIFNRSNFFMIKELEKVAKKLSILIPHQIVFRP